MILLLNAERKPENGTNFLPPFLLCNNWNNTKETGQKQILPQPPFIAITTITKKKWLH